MASAVFVISDFRRRVTVASSWSTTRAGTKSTSSLTRCASALRFGSCVVFSKAASSAALRSAGMSGGAAKGRDTASVVTMSCWSLFCATSARVGRFDCRQCHFHVRKRHLAARYRREPTGRRHCGRRDGRCHRSALSGIHVRRSGNLAAEWHDRHADAGNGRRGDARSADFIRAIHLGRLFCRIR